MLATCKGPHHRDIWSAHPSRSQHTLLTGQRERERKGGRERARGREGESEREGGRERERK